MKQFFVLCMITTLLLSACGNNKKQVTVVSEDGKSKATVDVNEAAAKADEMNKKVEELKKLTPLTTDQLKALVPEEFMGMKRSNFSVNSMTGAAFGSATYSGENEKELRVNIWDCAGEAGAGIYGMRYYTLWNFSQEDDNGYQKTIDFNGGKAIEKYSKSSDEYSLTYLANDRFLVDLEGEKMGLDAIKDAAKNLSLK